MKSEEVDISSIKQILAAGDIIQISLRMLGCINKDITAHNIRTAYLALNISRAYKMNAKCSVKNLVLLSIFHTLGYFREDVTFNYIPHDSNPEYFADSKACTSKYMFASFYLEYLTPLKEDARALSTFNRPYDPDLSSIRYQEDYKCIINLAAHISDFINKNPDKDLPADINDLCPGNFNPAAVEAFNKVNTSNSIIEKIKTDSYKQMLSEYLFSVTYSDDETKHLESLLVYFLDFKSTQTMKHAINTSCYAVALGKRIGLNQNDMSCLFISAALHDIGKIATPQRILEFPGRLSPEDMGIMRHHVNHSKRILSGFVPYDVLENVYRHHEKLNGKGYPCHVPGDQLNLLQRILTVADITSALNDSRSYKEEFSKEKTISIIKDMTDCGELDPEITKFVLEDFDNIMLDLKSLQELLKVDFSKVIANYNTYIFSDVVDELESIEEITHIEELDDFDEPEDIEDIEELEEL